MSSLTLYLLIIIKGTPNYHTLANRACSVQNVLPGQSYDVANFYSSLPLAIPYTCTFQDILKF